MNPTPPALAGIGREDPFLQHGLNEAGLGRAFALATGRRSRSVVVGALAVVGDVEAFALLVLGDAQADDQVDDLVEDRRADAGPDAA